MATIASCSEGRLGSLLLSVETRETESDPELARSLERAHAEQRQLRPELPGGVAGATRTGSVKCLHAHAAFALARPGYELGDRMLAELDGLWPDGGCCTPTE